MQTKQKKYKSIKKDGPKKEFTTTAVNKKSPDVRAVWLNYNELFATENDEMKYRQKMDTVFSRIANADLNVAFVQVRAFNDAFYKSDSFPPTKYICGGKANFDASTVHTLVIDEFDKCLEFGFQEEMAQVIGQLPRLKRRFLLSATDTEEIPRFTGLNRTQRLDFLNGEEEVSSRIHIYKVMSPVKDKLETLYRLLCTLGSKSTLVFCNHRESVERVGKYLQSQKYPCGIFHGGMEQDDRERSLYKFRNGSCHVLISTDLAARGLDIPEIEHVVHYHLPIQEDGYIHRNGRTARWEAEGNSYIILHPEELLPAYIDEEPETFDLPEETPKPSQPEFVTIYIGKGKKDKINKVDIVGFLAKKGNLKKEEIGRIDVKDHYAFVAVSRKKIKQTLGLIRNEKIKGVKTIIEEAK